MLDFESQAHKCQARVMPPINLHAAGERPVFCHFVKARLPGCKMHVEQKRLIIEHYGRMWCIGSGNYLVFRDDGEIMVMPPSAFLSVYKENKYAN